MKRDFLKNLGLEDNIIDKIMDENGKDTNSLKTQIANLTEELAVKDGVIETKNSKISEYEKVDIEALKKAEYEKGKAEGSAEIMEFKKQNSIEKALHGYKAKDTNILCKMLDLSKVEFNDKFEVVKGLDEQITPIKESHDYLFETEKKTPKFSDKTQGTETDTQITKEQFAKLSYNQRIALKEKDPDAYEKLKNLN